MTNCDPSYRLLNILSIFSFFLNVLCPPRRNVTHLKKRSIHLQAATHHALTANLSINYSKQWQLPSDRLCPQYSGFQRRLLFSQTSNKEAKVDTPFIRRRSGDKTYFQCHVSFIFPPHLRYRPCDSARAAFQKGSSVSFYVGHRLL